LIFSPYSIIDHNSDLQQGEYRERFLILLPASTSEYVRLFRIGFKTFIQVQSLPLKPSGIKSRAEGFKPSNIFNISSIEPLKLTQELCLRGGFETTSKDVPKIDFSLRIQATTI
jgi:hypothetical protein